VRFVTRDVPGNAEDQRDVAARARRRLVHGGGDLGSVRSERKPHCQLNSERPSPRRGSTSNESQTRPIPSAEELATPRGASPPRTADKRDQRLILDRPRGWRQTSPSARESPTAWHLLHARTVGLRIHGPNSEPTSFRLDADSAFISAVRLRYLRLVFPLFANFLCRCGVASEENCAERGPDFVQALIAAQGCLRGRESGTDRAPCGNSALERW
jgi:hypothetical protein